MQTTDVNDIDFAEAWHDLKSRLNSALDNLRILFRNAKDDEATRLAWKREAVDNAFDAWERINDQRLRGEINHIGAWRTFTDQVAHMFSVPEQHPGFYDGVALALSYQRGYAPHVDAPAIRNPHLKQV